MKYFLLLVVLISSLTINAQDEFYGENPEKCKERISIMTAYYRQKSFKDALPSLRTVLEICPQASKNTYIIGERIYLELIKDNKDDDELVDQYVDTLLNLYELRLKYFVEDDADRYSILARKGAALAKYKTKESYKEAYKILKMVVDSAPSSVSAYELQLFMFTAKLMVQTKNMDCTEMLDDFFAMSEIVAMNDGKKAKGFEKVEEKSVDYAGRCLDCELLDSLYTVNFEKNKEDTTWMDKGIELLKKKNCTSSDALVNLLESRFKTQPNGSTALTLGKYFSGSDKEKAEFYFNKAIELEQNPEVLSKHYLEKAKFHLNNEQYQTAKRYADNAVKENPNNTYAYIVIGDAIAYSIGSCNNLQFGGKEIYWVAVDYYNRAASVAGDDEDKIKSLAIQKSSKYASYYPEKGELFLQSLKDGDSFNVGCWINQNTKVRAHK